jgi:hypothetical protein
VRSLALVVNLLEQPDRLPKVRDLVVGLVTRHVELGVPGRQGGPGRTLEQGVPSRHGGTGRTLEQGVPGRLLEQEDVLEVLKCSLLPVLAIWLREEDPRLYYDFLNRVLDSLRETAPHASVQKVRTGCRQCTVQGTGNGTGTYVVPVAQLYCIHLVSDTLLP